MATFVVALPDDDARTEPSAVVIPSMRQLARRGIPQMLEGAVLPLGMFVVALHFFGVAPAIIAGLGGETLLIVRRLVQGRRIPGMMMVGAFMLVIRSVLALATGSVFLYFAQPTLATGCVAMAFLLSVVFRRPLARRFAGDFCDIPSDVHDDARVHSYFQRCSMMWAIVGFMNMSATLWLLLSQETATFLAAKTALGFVLTGGAVFASVIGFRRTMVRHGLITVA